MGIHVTVFRSALQGSKSPSSQVQKLTVINVPGKAEPSEDAPGYVLRSVGMSNGNHVYLVPAGMGKRSQALGFGGNYAASSERHFQAMCNQLAGFEFKGAIEIHDWERH